MWQQSLGVTITANKKYLHPNNIREKYSNITSQNIQYPGQKKTPKKPHGGGGP